MENALGREFDATRNAVREALGLLRDEGLVERVPGIGTVVVREKYPHGLNRLMGLAETLHGHGVVSNEMRTSGGSSRLRGLAARLGLTRPAKVVYWSGCAG